MSGDGLKLLSFLLVLAGLVTGGIVWSAINNATSVGNAEVFEVLPIVSMTAGPWLIAAVVAYAGGALIDAVVGSKSEG